MFRFIVILAFVACASAAPGFIAQTHSIVQPAAVLAKTAYVDNSASSAITHQSFTNLERKVAVAPVVQTYAAAAPVVKTVAHAPVVHTTYTAAAPLVHTYAAAPVVHHAYAASPVVHAAPLVKTVVSSPVAYTTIH